MLHSSAGLLRQLTFTQSTDTLSKYLGGKWIKPTAVTVAQVGRVHVCGYWPFLATWPAFFSPTTRPSRAWFFLFTFFKLCGQIHFGPFMSPVWAQHSTTLFIENHFTVYHGSDMHWHSAAQQASCGSGADPIGNNGSTRSHSFCTSRITYRVAVFTKATEG